MDLLRPLTVIALCCRFAAAGGAIPARRLQAEAPGAASTPAAASGNAVSTSTPVATAATTTTTSVDAGFACQSSYMSWSSAWMTSSDCGSITTPFVYPYWSTSFPENPSMQPTLCDGYPRAHGSPSSTLINTTVYQGGECYSTFVKPNAPPSPTCTIDSADCTALWSSYTVNQESYLSRTPRCSSVCVASAQQPNFFRACAFETASVELIYFPVSIKGNNLCTPYDYTTITSNVTNPVTAEAFGTTFTSGTLAWYSFQSLKMTDYCGNPLGTATSNFILPVPTTNVMTLGADGGNQLFNFADLNSPVPASAYQNMPACADNTIFGAGCATIYDGNFNPALVMPTELGDLQPVWSSCIATNINPLFGGLEVFFLSDPPTALQPANGGISTPSPPRRRDHGRDSKPAAVEAQATAVPSL